MIIRKVSSEKGMKHATISLQYDEIRTLSNLLYHMITSTENADEAKSIKNSKATYKLYTQMYELFGLVKEGVVYRTSVKPDETENENKILEIVTCKECRYLQQSRDNNYYCDLNGRYYNPDYFCADAKRKEQAKESEEKE